jgi:hypothetical protein
MKRMSGGNLRAAGYDDREKKLVVELTAGTYEYAGVTPEVWRRFSTASSPWSFFRDNIEEELRRQARPRRAYWIVSLRACASLLRERQLEHAVLRTCRRLAASSMSTGSRSCGIPLLK